MATPRSQAQGVQHDGQQHVARGVADERFDLRQRLLDRRLDLVRRGRDADHQRAHRQHQIELGGRHDQEPVVLADPAVEDGGEFARETHLLGAEPAHRGGIALGPIGDGQPQQIFGAAGEPADVAAGVLGGLADRGGVEGLRRGRRHQRGGHGAGHAHKVAPRGQPSAKPVPCNHRRPFVKTRPPSRKQARQGCNCGLLTPFLLEPRDSEAPD